MRTIHHDQVGRVLHFPDHWNGKLAICYLLGDGPGPQSEAVRLVGRPKREGEGFCVDYIRHYEGGKGHAARAYQFLVHTYGGTIDALGITSPEGFRFSKRMQEKGIVGLMELDIPDLDPEYIEERSGMTI